MGEKICQSFLSRFRAIAVAVSALSSLIVCRLDSRSCQSVGNFA